MIDIIVPCYNSNQLFLTRLLSSILCQGIVDECNVVLINDGSNEEYSQMYEYLTEIYNGLGLKTTLLTLDNNSGPATARQFGIDNSHSEYIVFADSDDVFHSPNALEILRLCMNEETDIVSGMFLEIMDHENTTTHSNTDTVWLFAKLFKRSFLEKNNIRFTEGRRANEDSEFNFIARLYTDNIAYVDDVTYEWRHDNINSIANHDDRFYSMDQSFIGMCEIAIDLSKKYGKEFPDKINELIVNRMIHAYYGCVIASALYPDFVEQSMYYAHKLYHYCWKDFDKEMIRNAFCKISLHKFDKSNMPVPYMSFPQFLELFKEHKFHEEDIIEIQKKLWSDEELKPMFENNIKSGSVPQDYYD